MTDVLFEIKKNGDILRTIDIAGLMNPALVAGPCGNPNTDAEGITWMYGDTYALVLEKGEEMLIVNINAATTSLGRSQSAIFDLSGDPKGVAYSAQEDALYWVSQGQLAASVGCSGPQDAQPMAIFKVRYNAQTRSLTREWKKEVDNLPLIGLADVAVFPRLTPSLLLLGQDTPMVMEVDVTGRVAVMKSSFSLAGWPIPRPGAVAFDSDGSFRVVGKHQANTPEDDFNVFFPAEPIPNRSPIANAGSDVETVDFTGRGAVVEVSGASSNDPDGAIVRYEWFVDGAVAASGFGPRVAPLSHSFLPGLSTVRLIVIDDAQASADATIQVQVRRFSGAAEDHPTSPFPQPTNYPEVSLNYIHSGSLIQRAEIFYELRETGFAEIHIYDQQGRQVHTFKTPTFTPGQYRAPWDLRNDSGDVVSSGAYFVLIKTPGNVKKDKVVVVR